MPLIRMSGVAKSYRMGEVEVEALAGVSLTVEAGEDVAIIGPSGSGKSTLMNLIGCLDAPTRGTYLFDGEDVGAMDRHRMAALRSRHIGFIFQSFNLLPRATALENVEIAMVYAGMGGPARRARALELLEHLGLGDRLHHLPSQLSGGQQQRVAIARALANRPKLLLADEPTGALDSASAQGILRLLDGIKAQGITVLLITHDPAMAATMGRVVMLADGRVVSDVRAAALEPVA